VHLIGIIISTMSEEKCFKAQLKEVSQKRSAELKQKHDSTSTTQELYNYIMPHLIECVRNKKRLDNTECVISLKKTFKMCENDAEPNCFDKNKLNQMLAPSTLDSHHLYFGQGSSNGNIRSIIINYRDEPEPITDSWDD